MHYQINYHESVKNDLKAIGMPWLLKIKDAIEMKLSSEPEKFGIHLRRTLKNYRKLRVGDYRVIFKIKNNAVEIFAIGHRSNIYKNFTKG